MMRTPLKPLLPALCLAVFGLSATTASAQVGVLDQQSPYFLNGMPLNPATGFSWQQEIAVGISGTLEGVVFRVYSTVAGDTATVNLYSGMGPHQPGSVPIFTGQVVANSTVATLSFVDMSSASISLSAGDTVTAELVADSQDMSVSFSSAFFQPLYAPFAYSEQPNGMFVSVAIERIGFDSYMLIGPNLTVSGACPGPVTLSATGMTAGSQVAFGGSIGAGSVAVPNGSCVGTVLGLSAIHLAGLATADASGVATLVSAVPNAGLCGTIVVQAIDVASCGTTNTIAL